MRVLVVGTVPPPGGKSAREVALIAAQRSAAGDVVEMLSPDPRSASHHTGNLTGLLLPLRLMAMAPRFDALELRLEPRLPLGEHAQRLLRAFTLVALGIVFGMYDEVTLRLDSPIPLPGGVGGRATQALWQRTTKIVVQNEADRQRILRAPGVHPDRVEIGAAAEVVPVWAEHAWPPAIDDDLREQVLHQIRLRANEERRANTARVDLGVTGVGPLHAEVFAAGTPLASSGSAYVRAAVSRLVRGVRSRLAQS